MLRSVKLANAATDVPANELQVFFIQKYSQTLSLRRRHVYKAVLHGVVRGLLELFLLEVRDDQ